MKKLILTIAIALLSWIMIEAQEIRQMTIPFEEGNLSFSYYEKDGVKIPHGIMEYTMDNYVEKGENKDGLKEGEWTLVVKHGNLKQKNTYNYKNGLLEGKAVFTSYKLDPKTKQEKESSREVYNFHKGHLCGENKIVIANDTIYCNFDNDGIRIGTWKFRSSDRTEIGTYNEGQLTEAYKMDVLGNKKEMIPDIFHNTRTINLLVFDSNKIKEIPLTIRKSRPELPSLSQVKYGYHSATRPIPEE